MNNTGLWMEIGRKGSGPLNGLSLSGKILFGNCTKEFYKPKEKSNIEVVDQLKEGETGKRIGIQKLTIDGGIKIDIVPNIEKSSGEKVNSPAILNKKSTTNGKTLWAGLQGDGKAKRKQDGKRDRYEGQGFIVIHAWKDSKNENNMQSWLQASSQQNSSIVKTIQLPEGERTYYLWDPNYTHIKNDGKFETIDGQRLPWNENSDFFTFKLVK